jgi:hypothetical protein
MENTPEPMTIFPRPTLDQFLAGQVLHYSDFSGNPMTAEFRRNPTGPTYVRLRRPGQRRAMMSPIMSETEATGFYLNIDVVPEQ